MIDLCPPETIHRVLEYFGERFGISPVVFGSWVFFAGPRGRVFLGPPTTLGLEAADTCGILIARVQKTVKPSTFLFQSFGRHVTRNIITLDREQTERFCCGEDIVLSADAIGDAARGFVMVAYDDLPLGCGLLKDGRLENQIPKPYRMSLKYW
ncbi:MAG: hypothetical protein KOO62_11035 [candidate division Zixibacteria bacterium]|nr:hypothetical protein [candidate division Zixibacteria bacterium]